MGNRGINVLIVSDVKFLNPQWGDGFNDLFSRACASAFFYAIKFQSVVVWRWLMPTCHQSPYYQKKCLAAISDAGEWWVSVPLGSILIITSRRNIIHLINIFSQFLIVWGHYVRSHWSGMRGQPRGWGQLGDTLHGFATEWLIQGIITPEQWAGPGDAGTPDHYRLILTPWHPLTTLTWGQQIGPGYRAEGRAVLINVCWYSIFCEISSGFSSSFVLYLFSFFHQHEMLIRLSVSL